ncbi:hypothetical protein [Pectobacterium parmentieri]|uniref:Uncharacterized protein n=1 Tax=Pectobacterium parmentieri TaxID=1905730 RepID=A0A8B3FPC4_PECPM|nr:hypothetical protein [Pectobacterium parmentieri]AOR61154.1 hypothetical protein A8F97_20005 [Pectobacterium parmentieri]AYH12712.1 hypothetical protein C5E24_22095 [Pectobacterium parmentieri]AYH21415.1 hypothetical protein C5E22_21975 [Pectobacterium parmentieri]AYH38984.1 hypothetical protein C5E17_21820 [Pectobacterium parmentieri]AZS59212.1 hypothetical protein C5E18_22505 [Pectobacterium parmentieri]
MKLLTTSEKKIILDDWKNALEVYEKYKTLYLIKRNGPVLCGVYLKPVYGGEHYVPIFHTHSMLSQFSAVTICTPHGLLNEKMAADSISIKRHKESLQDLVDKFREQCPIAFCGELSLSQLNKLYEDDINTSMIYPDLTMKNHVLLAFWFGYKEKSQQLILRYKEIIKSWPDEAKRRFNGDNAWEEDVRSQMDLDKLNNTVNEELAKFKLTKLKDHGLLPD